jgi:hypothetical protein
MYSDEEIRVVDEMMNNQRTSYQETKRVENRQERRDLVPI